MMHAELSDFFYVWLKSTAGHVFPELFRRKLTDKENEAVAKPARIAGQPGALALAGRAYRQRMAAIFAECRWVLKADCIMTLMFTHKATGLGRADHRAHRGGLVHHSVVVREHQGRGHSAHQGQGGREQHHPLGLPPPPGRCGARGPRPGGRGVGEVRPTYGDDNLVADPGQRPGTAGRSHGDRPCAYWEEA